MENGGHSLFEFISSAHQIIDAGHMDVSEWHKFVKIVFKQMIECIQYLHSLNICHFDISLENFLINNDIELLTYFDAHGVENNIFRKR